MRAAGQFDGERQAVKAGADGRHRGRVFFGQREFVFYRLCAFHKQRDCRKPRKHFQRRDGFEVGQRQRWDGKFMFAVDVQRRLARDHGLEFRANRQQLRKHRRGRRRGARNYRAEEASAGSAD